MARSSSVVLIACGSFNPITHMHLRIFERARDYLTHMLGVNVVAGVISPAPDAYAKKSGKDLVPAQKRVEMVNLALQTSDWIRVDDWESQLKEWTRTICVLRHHRDDIIQRHGHLSSDAGPSSEPPHHIDDHHTKPAIVPHKRLRSSGSTHGFMEDGKPSHNIPRLMLLCGADLLESFAVPNLWKDEDVEEIVRDFGLVVITRIGSDPMKFVYESDLLSKYEGNIHVVTEWITNDISSTKIRRSIRRAESIKYLVPEPVIKYIDDNGLYFGGPVISRDPSPSNLSAIDGNNVQARS